MKKVIVTGGRNYKDHITVNRVLNLINPDIVVEGGATGVDRLARMWALENEKQVITHEADWEKNGKIAGPIRNGEMLSAHPDAIVVAFPGGAGTVNCICTALMSGRLVLQVAE